MLEFKEPRYVMECPTFTFASTTKEKASIFSAHQEMQASYMKVNGAIRAYF